MNIRITETISHIGLFYHVNTNNILTATFDHFYKQIIFLKMPITLHKQMRTIAEVH